MSSSQIQKSYGSLKTLIGLDKPSRSIAQRYGPGWIQKEYKHLPGMTESGMERHRLTTAAIIKKNGRVGVEEVANQWTENIDITKFGFLLGPEDKIVYAGLKGGLPPWEVGRYSQSPGSIDACRMIMPIGMVHACFPDEAVRDALDVARLKDVQGRPLGNINGKIVYNYAVESSTAIAAATAEALRPKATVNSIVSTALAQLPEAARQEVEAGIDFAKKAKNGEELAKLFEQYYAGTSSSTALEVLSSSLACFVLAEGDPRNTIIYSVNLGREASSRASIAGGLAGALRGIQSVPTEWVEVIEKEVVDDSYTVSRLTARQAAEGIYKACLNEMQKTKTSNAKITSLMEK
jgi:ADP-ribosylglycohydrolase